MYSHSWVTSAKSVYYSERCWIHCGAFHRVYKGLHCYRNRVVVLEKYRRVFSDTCVPDMLVGYYSNANDTQLPGFFNYGDSTVIWEKSKRHVGPTGTCLWIQFMFPSHAKAARHLSSILFWVLYIRTLTTTAQGLVCVSRTGSAARIRIRAETRAFLTRPSRVQTFRITYAYLPIYDRLDDSALQITLREQKRRKNGRINLSIGVEAALDFSSCCFLKCTLFAVDKWQRVVENDGINNRT